MSESEKAAEIPMAVGMRREPETFQDFLIRMARHSAEIRNMLKKPIPPCPPAYAKLMTRFVTWNIEGNTLHIHLDDTSSARSLSEKFRRIKRDFSYLAQALMGSPEVTSVVGTSWIIGKNPELIERLGFTSLGLIDDEERQAVFPKETRPIGKAVMESSKFISQYFASGLPVNL